MQPWQDDLLIRLQNIKSESELFCELKKEASNIGFDHCAYGLRLPLPISAPKTLIFNSYPDDWNSKYIENYLMVDPTVRHGMSSTLPLVWVDDLFKDAREFWEDARSYGLRYGWAQSSIGPTGIRGMLSMARSEEQLSEKELQENAPRMLWLTQIAHHCMSKIVAEHSLPQFHVQLSEREKIVLRWTAEGKTSSEISDILCITERTVNFHISNVIQKLNCTNKTAAAVRAAMLNLLD
jgi:LuxR family transcriptional regulator